MNKYLEAFYERVPDARPCADSANSAISPGDEDSRSPTGTNGTNGTAGTDTDFDWCAYYDERAAIAEYDGGLSRGDAEREAFKACIVEWLRRNPVLSQPGACAHCGAPETPGSGVVVPFGTDTNGHTWLHHACWRAWSAEQWAAATVALAGLGIFDLEIEVNTRIRG